MTPDVLVLRESVPAVWDAFARGDLASPGAEDAVITRWRRARALGAALEGPSPEDHLLRGEELAIRTERVELVTHVAADELDRAAGSVSPRDYVLLLADPNGLVVRASGGGRFEPIASRARLVPGASWSEANRGTNAIGTAVAEARPVFVRGNAHFARRFHDLVCYAAPIFDADGSVIAVLDATSTFELADDDVGSMVVRAARAISQALRDRAFGRAGAAVTRTLSRALERMDGVALLVESPSIVTQTNPGARALFGESRGRTIEELLGVPMAELVAESRAPTGLELERAGVRYAVRLEPIETNDGVVIALLVLLEPRRLSRVPPAPVAPRARDSFDEVFSRDPRLEAALSWAVRLADGRVPVLLLAETGSGKELVARAIHRASRRADAPFVAVNCGAIAPTLLESELFGYGPAAFTGAERAGRDGLLAAASGGTLFLDEVAEMPLTMQAALLRVLEDGTYRRVGETTTRRVDVRVLSATCADLDVMVERGTFRRDLYFRLKGAEVSLPALRDRVDLAELADHLLVGLARSSGRERAPAIAADALETLVRHRWPGNVRELRSVLEVALLLVGEGATIGREHLPPQLLAAASSQGSAPAELASAERATVSRVLAEVSGNVSRAAERLGVARSTLYRMIRRHRLDG